MSHHATLLCGYAAAVAGWWLLQRIRPALWPAPPAPSFAHPWREVGWALLGVAGVVAVGQLYTRGWLLPATSKRRPGLDALNQLLIYGPILAVPILRRQPAATAWLKTDRVPLRMGVGLLLALLAITVYAAIDRRVGWLRLVSGIYRPAHVSYLVQVLFEDLAIAILLVRLTAALGRIGAIVLTACLFAAAHIPGMLSGGAAGGAIALLALDVILVVVVLGVARRSADVWWLWCVHFAMDMTQFARD